MDTTDTKPLTTLSEAESIELLGTQEVGRLVYTRRALPAVTPVNFALHDDAVWIWTASSSSMWQAVRGAVVAFEADELDAASRSGWSVVVVGVAELVSDPARLERARELGPEPWVGGRKEYLLRIPLKLVSGRRVQAGEPDPDRGGSPGPGAGSPLARS